MLVSDLPPAEFSRAHFRRVFDVEKVPPRYRFAYRRIRGTCCGSTVPRLAGGPSDRNRGGCGDEFDIAVHLRPGRNVVAVPVTYYGHANSFWRPAARAG